MLEDAGPCVAVQYKALPKESKLYLEKVLQDWLVWHRRSFPSEVANIPVLSGALEFSPSLLPSGSDAVPLAWVDKPARSGGPRHPKLGFNLSYEMVGDVPRYDCTSEQPLDAQDAERRAAERMDGVSMSQYVVNEPRRSRPRCFNCGSYYHALKDCLLSKDAEAISRARSEHQDRGRNGLASGRYFLQASAAGEEFTDLQPGVLSEELRAAMGLKPEDPPPWLWRMRQMGYPPGYRRQTGEESDEEVIIIEDDDTGHNAGRTASTKHTGSGVITEAEELVAFPGVNAPIPANADPAVWFGQPRAPLIDGMTPEERGFKRSRSNSGGGVDYAEHAAKRARTSGAVPPDTQAALQRLQALAQPNQGNHHVTASAPLQHAAYGPPSGAPYGPAPPYPPPLQPPYGLQHPYGQQQPQAQGSQQWAPAHQPPAQLQAQQGMFAFDTPPSMYPAFAPLPHPPTLATPQNGAPPQHFYQLPGGFQSGQAAPGGGFAAAAPGGYLGAPGQMHLYQHPGSAPQQPQQQQHYDSMQWAAHSVHFHSTVEGLLPPPPPLG